MPILFLTAADYDPHLAFRGYQAGAVDYISNPSNRGCCGRRFHVRRSVGGCTPARRAGRRARGAARVVDDALALLGLPGFGPVTDEVLDRVRGRLGAVRAGVD